MCYFIGFLHVCIGNIVLDFKAIDVLHPLCCCNIQIPQLIRKYLILKSTSILLDLAAMQFTVKIWWTAPTSTLKKVSGYFWVTYPFKNWCLV